MNPDKHIAIKAHHGGFHVTIAPKQAEREARQARLQTAVVNPKSRPTMADLYSLMIDIAAELSDRP